MESFDTKFTRIYKTTKVNNKELFFKLNYKIYYQQNKRETTYIRVAIKISYLALFIDNKIVEVSNSFNEWELSGSTDSAHLENCIDINTKYQSFGIGSFVLNKLLNIANNHAPEYRLYGTLELLKDSDINKLRRNTMYQNAGFNVLDKEINIEKINQLRLNRDFEYIKEYSDVEFFNILLENEKKIEDCEKNLQTSANRYKSLSLKNDFNNKYNKYVTSALWFLIIFIFGQYIYFTNF